MIRVKIRDLMLIVLHVAIDLSILIGFMKIWPPNDPRLYLTLVIFITLASGVVSVVTVKPGPRRDWVAMFLFAVALLGLAVCFAVPVILAPRFVHPAGGWRKYGLIECSAFYDLMFWGWLVFVVRHNLVPRACPHCRKRGLVPAVRQDERRYRKPIDVCCLTCDLVLRVDPGTKPVRAIRVLGSVAKPLEDEMACPACGQVTLRRIPYEFFWCLRCGSRYKRVRRGAWEDAGGSDDDAFYWLWTLHGWLTTQIRRIAREGHPSD